MSKNSAIARAVSLLCLAMFPLLYGSELEYDLDATRTKVTFTLGDVLHTVHGSFALKAGHISIDPSSGVIDGNITVDAASGNSGNSLRDRRMTHSILEAGHYPEVRFSPKTFSGSLLVSSSSNVTVAGTFLIHGQEHEVTIPMHVQMSADEMNATGTFLVPYVQWGMKNPSTFILKVNDKVQIDLTVVARRVPSRP